MDFFWGVFSCNLEGFFTLLRDLLSGAKKLQFLGQSLEILQNLAVPKIGKPKVGGFFATKDWTTKRFSEWEIIHYLNTGDTWWYSNMIWNHLHGHSLHLAMYTNTLGDSVCNTYSSIKHLCQFMEGSLVEVKMKRWEGWNFFWFLWFNTKWFCPHTLGRYPRLPLSPHKERNSLRNCWWMVQGIFQGALWVRS